MVDRLPGYLYGGTPINSWERGLSQFDNLYTRSGHSSPGFRSWGSMSDGGGVSNIGMGGGGGGMPHDNSRTNLIVNYLPQNITEKELYAMFVTCGPIESCKVMKDFKTGYSFGFGFVNFMREDDASRAIDTYNGYNLRNKRLKVSYARPSGEEIKDTNLYVTNLPRTITDEQIETIFGKYGRIVQQHILRDKHSGLPRGVAFVRYDKREEAQEAIAALNNVIPQGASEALSVKIAEEHGKQKAAFYGGWNPGPGPGYPQPPRGDYGWDDYSMMGQMGTPPSMFVPPAYPNKMGNPGGGYGAPFGKMLRGKGIPRHQPWGPSGDDRPRNNKFKQNNF